MLPFVCFSLSFSYFFCREITIRSIHDVKQQIVLLIAYWKQVWKTKTKNKIVACVSFVVVVVGCKAREESTQRGNEMPAEEAGVFRFLRTLIVCRILIG